MCVCRVCVYRVCVALRLERGSGSGSGSSESLGSGSDSDSDSGQVLESSSGFAIAFKQVHARALRFMFGFGHQVLGSGCWSVVWGARSPASAIQAPLLRRGALLWRRNCVGNHLGLDMLAAARCRCRRRDASPHVRGARDRRSGFNAADCRVLLRKPRVADEQLFLLEPEGAAWRLRCLGQLTLPSDQTVVSVSLCPPTALVVQAVGRRPGCQDGQLCLGERFQHHSGCWLGCWLEEQQQQQSIPISLRCGAFEISTCELTRYASLRFFSRYIRL